MNPKMERILKLVAQRRARVAHAPIGSGTSTSVAAPASATNEATAPSTQDDNQESPAASDAPIAADVPLTPDATGECFAREELPPPESLENTAEPTAEPAEVKKPKRGKRSKKSEE